MRSKSEPNGYKRAGTVDSAEHGSSVSRVERMGWGVMS